MRSCRVSFTDANKVEHAVTVTADSLYEAVGLAIKAFEWSGWIEYQPESPMYKFEVASVEPVVNHAVTRRPFDEWLARPGGSPRDVMLKRRLRELLGITSSQPPC